MTFAPDQFAPQTTSPCQLPHATSSPADVCPGRFLPWAISARIPTAPGDICPCDFFPILKKTRVLNILIFFTFTKYKPLLQRLFQVLDHYWLDQCYMLSWWCCDSSCVCSFSCLYWSPLTFNLALHCPSLPLLYCRFSHSNIIHSLASLCFFT